MMKVVAYYDEPFIVNKPGLPLNGETIIDLIMAHKSMTFPEAVMFIQERLELEAHAPKRKAT